MPNALAAALLFDTRNTLNLTVLDSGRHCPAQIRSDEDGMMVQHLHTDCDHVANLSTEGRRKMGSQIFVALLVSVYHGCEGKIQQF